MKKEYITIICLAVFIGTTAEADAKVDGFFPENLVKGDYFEDKHDSNLSNDHNNTRDSFFISREERRLNPQKAPSNNIKVEPSVFRMRTNDFELRNPWNPRY